MAERVFRPVTLADEARLAKFFGRLSPESVYHRFFAMIHEIDPRRLRQLADNDGWVRVALAAEEEGEIIAVGRYAVDDEGRTPESAELAIVVEDRHQGHHLGPDLLRALAGLARQRGIRRFHASVLGENTRALHVFRAVFPNLRATFSSSTYELDIPLDSEEAPAALGGSRG